METIDAEHVKMKNLLCLSLKQETPLVFQEFCRLLDEQSCTTLRDLNRSKKEKGTMWEYFCREYLLKQTSYTRAVLLKDVDSHTLEMLSLRKMDVGIDIIAFDADNRPVAIQCKFRKKGSVSWREIATFEALCARSGPWSQQIVMTNARFVRREGRKNESDLTIGFGSFQSLKRHQWNSIAGVREGNTLQKDSTQSAEEIKSKWLSRLEKTHPRLCQTTQCCVSGIDCFSYAK